MGRLLEQLQTALIIDKRWSALYRQASKQRSGLCELITVPHLALINQLQLDRTVCLRAEKLDKKMQFINECVLNLNGVHRTI